MPDIGWMELLVIGVVALIVVGPEDLPGMFKKLGQMVGKVRGMAKDFTNAMNEAASHLLGQHDFASFCRRPKVDEGVPEKSLVRILQVAQWHRVAQAVGCAG